MWFRKIDKLKGQHPYYEQLVSKFASCDYCSTVRDSHDIMATITKTFLLAR